MQGAAFLHQVQTVDGYDFSVGKLIADHTKSAIIVFGLAKGGNEDGVVQDKKVDVGGR